MNDANNIPETNASENFDHVGTKENVTRNDERRPQIINSERAVPDKTSKAFAMILYFAGLISIIIALCMRDKSNRFIEHHLDQALVIFIGYIVMSIIAFVPFIGFIGVILDVYLVVMTIMGCVDAYHGDTTDLPLIGSIRILR